MVLSATFFFYPIAGYLADNKYGRFKTVMFGLWLLLPSSIFFVTDVSLTLKNDILGIVYPLVSNIITYQLTGITVVTVIE